MFGFFGITIFHFLAMKLIPRSKSFSSDFKSSGCKRIFTFLGLQSFIILGSNVLLESLCGALYNSTFFPEPYLCSGLCVSGNKECYSHPFLLLFLTICPSL